MRGYSSSIEISRPALERLEAIRDYLEDMLDVRLGLSEVLSTIIEQVNLEGIE